jgi:uncharacterized protein
MLIKNHPSIAKLRPSPALAPTLAEKIAFLHRGDSYRPHVAKVTSHETHMSLVFLAGDRAYKLKKPVRFPYLDFSTVERRHVACDAELALNRRLAPGVYREVVPLVQSPQGLAIGGDGEIVDWLVVMRRLDENQMFERVISGGDLDCRQLERVIATLVGFYRRTDTVLISSTAYISEFRRGLAYDRRVLLDPRFRLPAGMVRHIECAQRGFLSKRNDMLAERVRGRHIVDGHGDLRPEHIFLGETVRIIDCLEFNARLRMVDPLDEIAFLCVECERLGVAWAGEYLRQRISHLLGDDYHDELFTFYRCHRATLRARLAVAHLLEPVPRTPEKWPILARSYLRIAAVDAGLLERALKKRAGRPANRRHADGELLRPKVGPQARFRASCVQYPN